MACFLLIHAWKCSPESVRPLARRIQDLYPDARVLAPRALLDDEWFSYLTDHRGAQEDLVDTRKLRGSRGEILSLLAREAVDVEKLVVVGFSQGGCMALDLATHVKVLAVITVVSHVLYASRPLKLLAPWYALVCERDDVFPLRGWAGVDLHRASSVEVHSYDHYVPDSVAERFVLRSATIAIERQRKERAHDKRARGARE